MARAASLPDAETFPRFFSGRIEEEEDGTKVEEIKNERTKRRREQNNISTIPTEFSKGNQGTLTKRRQSSFS